MSCADDFFKFLCKWVLDNCPEDMIFVSKRIDKTCIDRLQSIVYSKVEKITYTEVVDVLGKVYHTKSSLDISSNDRFHMKIFHLIDVFLTFHPRLQTRSLK